MAGHKLTILGHPAYKKIQTYLQGQDLSDLGETRRLAYADGVIAISGASGLKLMSEYYHLDPVATGLFERFEVMLAGYGFRNVLQRPPHVCAEAHLWLTLVGRHCRHVQEKLGSSPSARSSATLEYLGLRNRPQETTEGRFPR